ncbi:MAG: hypothetical protein ABIQ05_07480 [Candidatus Limnocylindria bacterium]
MNWRAIGCGLLAATVFVAIGLLGMSMAFSRADGCPERVQWGDAGYLPVGSETTEPAFADGGDPVEIGSTFVGLTTRRVWGPPGSVPYGSIASGSVFEKPQQIILECGDGTFQEYRAELSSE